MLEPHNTTVSSFIFYECQQPGFAPSNSSAICGEDGMWSPDPSLVMCLEKPTTTSIPTRVGGVKQLPQVNIVYLK